MKSVFMPTACFFLIIQSKYLAFQLLSCVMGMFFTILARVKNRCFSRWKCLFFPVPMSSNMYSYSLYYLGLQMGACLYKEKLYFSNKSFFWSLISKMKVTCMLIACFVFWFFTVNAFLFSSYIVTYVSTFPS